MREVTTEAIVEDIRAVASRLGCLNLSRTEYVQHGKYSHYDLYDGGRTWEDLCTAAGIQSKKIEPVPDEVYFKRLQDAVSSLGRLPKTSERKRFGLNFRKSRWPTLNSFIQTAIERGIVPPQAGATLPQRPSTSTGYKQTPVPEKDKVAAETPRPMTSGTRSVPPIPARTKRRKWRRTDIEGFPYVPQDEQGIVALFAILCNHGRIPWQILDLNAGRGIDATCYDDMNNRELRVELKHLLSQSSWNHSIEDLDYVVCWENRWPDFPKPVIELRKLIEDLSDEPLTLS